MMRCVTGLSGYFGRNIGPVRVIDQGRGPRVPDNIDLCAKGVGKPSDNITDPRFNLLLHLCAMCPKRPFQLNGFR